MSMSAMEPSASQNQDAPQIPMDPMTVRMFHMFSDVDSDSGAQHHTIGTGANQAASGAHTHNGSDSPVLYNGTISGSRGNNAALASLISTLCSQTGMVDGTTA